MNLLFLAFEGEAHAMAHLAMRFKAGGHSVFVLSCDHFNVTHTRGEVFAFHRRVGLAESEFGNFEGVYRELNDLPESLPDDAVDWKYLRTFEARYCKRFTLLEMVAMDPLLSGAYHHRTIYYRPAIRRSFSNISSCKQGISKRCSRAAASIVSSRSTFSIL